MLVRVKQDFSNLAVGNRLHAIEVAIVSGHFHATAPAIGPEEDHAVGVGHLGPVDLDRVIVKPFVERARIANPGAVFPLHELRTIAERHTDALRFRRHDPELHTPLGIDLRIFVPRLIRRRGLEVVGDSLR